MFTVKFSPTALNFGYDFVLLVHFFGTPCMWVSSSLTQECSWDPVICCKHLLSRIILVFLESKQSSHQAYLAVLLYVHALNLLRLDHNLKRKWSLLTFFSLIKYDSDKTNGLQSRKILIIIIIIRKTASHKVFVAWRCCIFWTLNTLTCANFYMKYGRKGQRKVKVVLRCSY